jgi:ABC-type sugar transport system ATPase subunit
VLDIALRDFDGISIVFARNTHTAIIGTGASELLKKIAGVTRSRSGSMTIGARDVTSLRRSQRPLLYATPDVDAPLRWSVRHLLIAAVRQRSLDRIDRQREFDFVAAKWKLESLLDRALRTLAPEELTVANIARIELLKPAILIADGVVDRARVAPEFYRILRVLGTTVVSTPANLDELGFTDQVVILDDGKFVQQGTFSQVYRSPMTAAAARASGDVNLIPVTVHQGTLESPIGSWRVETAGFEGEGLVAARPEHFEVAPRGEESDFIFGVEEATFHGDHWSATGFLSGNLTLTVSLPAATELHKGRLLPLRYDPSRFTVLRV